MVTPSPITFMFCLRQLRRSMSLKPSRQRQNTANECASSCFFHAALNSLRKSSPQFRFLTTKHRRNLFCTSFKEVNCSQEGEGLLEFSSNLNHTQPENGGLYEIQLQIAR